MAHIIFKWLWKGACKVRHKIYIWVLLHDIVNTTRNLLKRRSMHLDCYECVFCNEGVEETLMHLFWGLHLCTRILLGYHIYSHT